MKRGRCDDPGAPCHLFAHPRVNVTLVPERSDAALRRTQAVVHEFVRVTGLPQLGQVLRRVRGCRLAEARRTLDLLAHADADGRLVLGTSLLAPDDGEVVAFAERHREDLRALGVERVRLLGCYTGHGDKARAALVYLRERLAVPVYGCVDTVGETLFDVDGLSPKWDTLFVAP